MSMVVVGLSRLCIRAAVDIFLTLSGAVGVVTSSCSACGSGSMNGMEVMVLLGPFMMIPMVAVLSRMVGIVEKVHLKGRLMCLGR